MPKKVREPKNPFHPGEILLEEFLQPMEMTQTAFAEQVGWTRARLNELIRGKRGLRPTPTAEVLDQRSWRSFQGW